MLPVLRSRLLQSRGFPHGFSPRQGGVSRGAFAGLNLGREVGDDVSAVAENHRRFAASVGYAPAGLYETRQVHGADVHVVASGSDPAIARQVGADALLAPGGVPRPDAAGPEGAQALPIAVGVRTADCMPLLVADPVGGTVAAVHAGWRGVAGGIVAAAFRGLQEHGALPERLLVALFPHIRACCFEVGPEVVPQLVGDLPEPVRVRALLPRSPRPHVDLSVVVTEQLLALGVRAEHIDDVAGCTRCDAERFFSYRRDGSASGRHVTAIVPRGAGPTQGLGSAP